MTFTARPLKDAYFDSSDAAHERPNPAKGQALLETLAEVTNRHLPHTIEGVRNRLARSGGQPPPRCARETSFAGGTTPGRFGTKVLLLVSLTGCQPQLDIGAWTCSANGTPSEIPDRTARVAAPWSSGFENRFCDYTELAGFCYADETSAHDIVTSPVRSGRYAAAFTVQSDAGGGSQTRCVRQGELPTAAYYGAWYYIPEPTTPSANWNLFHFRGGEDLSATRGVLDVSLVAEGQDLHLAVFGMGHAPIGESMRSASVPFGSWFHVQLYLKRAEDTTGEVALYQDGQEVFDVTGVRTDDSTLGQWYVGNLANGLSPSASTVYVDDVTLSSTL